MSNNLIEHSSLGKLHIYGTALHTEEERDYTIYYLGDSVFIAAPSEVDIHSITLTVDREELSKMDFNSNIWATAKHYKGGTYLISGNVYDVLNSQMLVEYSSLIDGNIDKSYLRPHKMFYSKVEVPRFEVLVDED